MASGGPSGGVGGGGGVVAVTVAVGPAGATAAGCAADEVGNAGDPGEAGVGVLIQRIECGLQRCIDRLFELRLYLARPGKGCLCRPQIGLGAKDGGGACGLAGKLQCRRSHLHAHRGLRL